MTKDFEKLYQLFKSRAEAAAAQVYRVQDMEQAGQLFTALVIESGADKVVAASSPMVTKCLEGASLPVPVYTEDLHTHAEKAYVGLSQLDMAVADIGALQQDCTDINQRLVSMLPQVHVALVKTTSLVKDLKEAFELLAQQADNFPGYVSFITGPSRTADIERVLTIGVHGPSQLKIIFVDDPGGVLP